MSTTTRVCALQLLLTVSCQAQQAQDAAPPEPVLQLSLSRAVEIGLSPERNAEVQLAEEAIRNSQAKSRQERADLLPNLDAYVTKLSATRNLQALGLAGLSPAPGFAIPEFVGPFNLLDTRAEMTQSIFDLGSIRRLQASRAGTLVAKAERANLANEIAAQVVSVYLAALRAEAARDSAKATTTLAEALLRLAEDKESTGTGTMIEVRRAQAQLSVERQHVQAAESDCVRAHLRLRKALGINLDTPIALTDKLMFIPVRNPALEQAQTLALRSRADLQAQSSREEHARLAHDATGMERLPSLRAFGDYGTIGRGVDRLRPTRTYGVSIQVPLFDGGRREARRAEALSALYQEQIRERDLREQIRLELRLAREGLRAAEQQVTSSQESLRLSEDELSRASRRYQAGVANNLEVIDAQTRVARARDDYVAALFSYNLARMDLGVASGTIRSAIQTWWTED